MSERLKILMFVAMLGFVGGVIADLAGRYLLPWLASILPEILNARWILSGLAGAILTVSLVTIWAYVSPRGPGE